MRLGQWGLGSGDFDDDGSIELVVGSAKRLRSGDLEAGAVYVSHIAP